MRRILCFMLLLLSGSDVEAESLQSLELAAASLSHPVEMAARGSRTHRPSDISARCWVDVLYTGSKLHQAPFSALWAFKMVDSSSKLPAGLASGNFWDLGNFDECLSINVDDGKYIKHSFEGKHCVISFSLSTNHANEDIDVKALDPEPEPMAALGSALEQLQLHLSWCVPSTCSSQDVQQLANMIGGVVSLQGKTDDTHCHTKRHIKLRPVDKFAICFLSFFVALAVLSTAYDILTRSKDTRRNVFLAFSVYTNGQKLLAVSRKGDQIWCLHGVRFLSICWVILCHRYSEVLPLPMMNALDLMDFFQGYWRLPIMNGTLSVDTFFVMSGLLLSFLFLKEVNRSGRFDVFKFYIHRYLRITPMVGVVILLVVTLLQYGGWGPLWEEKMQGHRESCEKNWWVTLMYLNSYINTNSRCLGYTWYLAVDMQLYWLSPLILIPLWKFRRIAKMWIAFLLLTSIAIPFAVIYIEEILDAPSLKYLDKKQSSFEKYYVPAYTRFSTWLIGIILGAILYSDRKTKIRKIHPVAVAAAWVASIALIVGSVSAAYPFEQTDYVYSRVEAAFYGSLFRVAFALGVSWIIFACDRGYGGFINSALSWGFFQPLSRLSFGLYMTHLIWMNFTSGFTRTQIYFSDVTLIPQFFGDILMSVVWTIPLVLLFEAPVLALEKVVFGAVRRPVQSIVSTEAINVSVPPSCPVAELQEITSKEKRGF